MTTRPSTSELIRSVLALKELGLRVGWLRDTLHRVTAHSVAPALDEIAQEAYSGLPRAREALLAVSVFLVIDRESPSLEDLRAAARQHRHFNLERLLRRGEAPAEPSTDDREPTARVPDYGAGRELTVGERRALARRPTRQQLERLLSDPHPLVLDLLLQCPTLTEIDVLRLVSRRPASQAALRALCSRPTWLARRRVRLALILNPGTPLPIALPLVATAVRDDLESIVKTTNLSLIVRSAAHELFLRLPPMEPESDVLQ